MLNECLITPFNNDIAYFSFSINSYNTNQMSDKQTLVSKISDFKGKIVSAYIDTTTNDITIYTYFKRDNLPNEYIYYKLTSEFYYFSSYPYQITQSDPIFLAVSDNFGQKINCFSRNSTHMNCVNTNTQYTVPNLTYLSFTQKEKEWIGIGECGDKICQYLLFEDRYITTVLVNTPSNAIIDNNIFYVPGENYIYINDEIIDLGYSIVSLYADINITYIYDNEKLNIYYLYKYDTPKISYDIHQSFTV